MTESQKQYITSQLTAIRLGIVESGYEVGTILSLWQDGGGQNEQNARGLAWTLLGEISLVQAKLRILMTYWDMMTLNSEHTKLPNNDVLAEFLVVGSE